MKKSIKSITNHFKDISKKTLIVYAVITVVMLFMSADPDTKPLDDITKYILAWVSRIGIVVAIFGAIQTALGFKNDDADAKVRGLKTLASGLMVSGIANAPDLLGF